MLGICYILCVFFSNRDIYLIALFGRKLQRTTERGLEWCNSKMKGEGKHGGVELPKT